MSRKPKHLKAKYSRKHGGRPGQLVTPVQSPIIGQKPEPPPLPQAPPQVMEAPAPTAPASYPYIATELKTVAVIAGVMLVVLITLGLTLS